MTPKDDVLKSHLRHIKTPKNEHSVYVSNHQGQRVYVPEHPFHKYFFVKKM